MKLDDLKLIEWSFKNACLSSRFDVLKKYLNEQKNAERYVITAKTEKQNIIGYTTLAYNSKYKGFREANIPEITDLNVIPTYRNKGIAHKMISKLEEIAKEKKYSQIGIGAGLYSDYGSAQRLYVKIGYIPNGKGLLYDNKKIKKGQSIIVDDSLAIYFTKTI